jgi:hypothetical protein
MDKQINLSINEPRYYLERIEAGCILDPSIFYSDISIEAAMAIVSAIKPNKVYMPSNLYDAYKKASWTSFLSTLTLWSGNYEKLPNSWHQGGALMQELNPVPIEMSGTNERIHDIFEAMAEKGKLSPLYKILFEMTACSLQNSMPILVGAHSKFRLIELLNSKLQVITVELLGGWARDKKEWLVKKKRRIAIFALAVIGGAWIFIEPLSIPSIFGGVALASIILDGS